jgi:O-acetyl-ADP-ribose deacetylase (regulator of RNase III)
LKPIAYVIGDATLPPAGPGIRLIVHVCNDVGAWGAGFVLALSKRSKAPEIAYRRWRKSPSDNLPFELGQIQLAPFVANGVPEETFVVNMLAQSGIGERRGPPIRYDALRECLSKVREAAKALKATIHGPRFGCGLGGGEWPEVEAIINDEICAHDLSITIYDLE